MEGKQRLVVIGGPTASGKSALAVELALRVGGEILSADSMAVYRGMDIGTAKPSLEERRGVTHHLIDVASPDEPFSAAEFRARSVEVLDRLKARGCPAVVVGGTGLYVRALVRGLFEGPPANPELRRRLEEEEDQDPGTLHRRLTEVDPASAARLHPRDRVRLVRALEVQQLSGRALSSWVAEHAFSERPYDVMYFCLELPREEMDLRIDRRVDQMMKVGLREEVAGLLARGYGPELRPMNGLGYLHMCQHLLGGMALDEAVRTLKRDTRKFARRQLTWNQSEHGVRYVAADEHPALLAAASQHLLDKGFSAI